MSLTALTLVFLLLSLQFLFVLLFLLFLLLLLLLCEYYFCARIPVIVIFSIIIIILIMLSNLGRRRGLGMGACLRRNMHVLLPVATQVYRSYIGIFRVWGLGSSPRPYTINCLLAWRFMAWFTVANFHLLELGRE